MLPWGSVMSYEFAMGSALLYAVHYMIGRKQGVLYTYSAEMVKISVFTDLGGASRFYCSSKVALPE
jgi:hypothetical protein